MNRNAKVVELLFLYIGVEFQHVQDGLRVPDLILLGDCRGSQEPCPLFRKTLIEVK
jgi:hypothetical protein